MPAGDFLVGAGSRAVLVDLGMSPAALLRRAGLPASALDAGALATRDYYALWEAIAEEGGPDTAALVAEVLRVETLDPAVYAALCSADLAAAATRIRTHKRLMCPMTLEITEDERGLRVRLVWPPGPPPPPVLVHVELAFWVQLARTGTRTRVVPLRLSCPEPPTSTRLLALLGAPVVAAAETSVTFTRLDAHRRFVTADEAVWTAMEPVLERRADQELGGAVSERVSTLLLELLPAADASARTVADRLGLSSRTLQRRLAAEGTTFQRVLDQTRERLARHYLATDLRVDEIAFLLGYDEPTSFYRAFAGWTGTTPLAARRAPA